MVKMRDFGAFDRGHFKHVAARKPGGQILFPIGSPLVDEHALQSECSAHDREQIGRHGGLHIRAQARPNAMIECCLKRRDSMSFLHLDGWSDRHLAARVSNPFPNSSWKVGAMYIFIVRTHEPGAVKRD